MEVSACPAECVEYACECSLSLWLEWSELGVEKQGGGPGNDLAVLAMRLATHACPCACAVATSSLF